MNKLKDWMRKQNKTQGTLAQELGLHRVYVNQVVNGSEPITDSFLWKFFAEYGTEATCEAFDVEVKA